MDDVVEKVARAIAIADAKPGQSPLLLTSENYMSATRQLARAAIAAMLEAVGEPVGWMVYNEAQGAGMLSESRCRAEPMNLAGPKPRSTRYHPYSRQLSLAPPRLIWYRGIAAARSELSPDGVRSERIGRLSPSRGRSQKRH